jgi:hypothetical protein
MQLPTDYRFSATEDTEATEKIHRGLPAGIPTSNLTLASPRHWSSHTCRPPASTKSSITNHQSSIQTPSPKMYRTPLIPPGVRDFGASGFYLSLYLLRAEPLPFRTAKSAMSNCRASSISNFPSIRLNLLPCAKSIASELNSEFVARSPRV